MEPKPKMPKMDNSPEIPDIASYSSDDEKKIASRLKLAPYKWISNKPIMREDVFPMKKWKVTEFLEEIVHESEKLLLGFDHDVEADKMLIASIKILRQIVRIKPTNSAMLKTNPRLFDDLEKMKKTSPPVLKADDPFVYTAGSSNKKASGPYTQLSNEEDLSEDNIGIAKNNMLVAISRYFEGLIFGCLLYTSPSPRD